MDNVTSSPLFWPSTMPRTAPHNRKQAPFGTGHTSRENFTIDAAVRLLTAEMKRLNIPSWNFILSTNLRLRNDGLPYSNQRMPDDPGAAVYFKLEGRDTVFPCDRWNKVQDNIYAIAKHIDALRGQDRWGVGTRAQAFAGYAALPGPGDQPRKRSWRAVLECDERGDIRHPDDLSVRYRSLAKERRGDEAKLLELNLARDEAREELNG